MEGHDVAYICVGCTRFNLSSEVVISVARLLGEIETLLSARDGRLFLSNGRVTTRMSLAVVLVGLAF